MNIRYFLVAGLTAIALASGSGCAVLPLLSAGDPPTAVPPVSIPSPTLTDAERIAKDCHTKILGSLKTPGSAKFVEEGETATEHFLPADGTEGREVDHHAVATFGHVDSQNSFGGLMRTRFYCFTVTEAGGSLVEGRPIVSETGVDNEVSDMITQLQQPGQRRLVAGLRHPARISLSQRKELELDLARLQPNRTYHVRTRRPRPVKGPLSPYLVIVRISR